MKKQGSGRWWKVAAVLLVFFVFYAMMLLPFLKRWGATEKEVTCPLPGDELVTQKDYRNTLALTVRAPASEVWPWVAQMGLHKGGFYSYTILENLFGCRLHNADSIHPEWQYPQVGYLEPVCQSQEGKPGAGWNIALVQKNRALVWKGAGGAQWMMGVYIEPIDKNSCRLVTRQQFRYPPRWSADWVLEQVWFSWAHCVMQRGMLQGIKKRAEA